MARRRHPNHRPASTLPVELRRTVVPAPVRAWVARQAGADVVDVERLQGASSAAMHRVQLADGRRLVLRRYVWRRLMEDEPELPRREVDVLRNAHEQGLGVPEVVAADLSGADIGDGIPAILMTHLRGQPLADPDPVRLAASAIEIHSLDGRGLGHDYAAWYEDEMTTPPPASQQPELWERAIDIWRHAMPPYSPVLIHRDFHPGNVLWSRHAVTGIVDWANGCVGPAGCDVATCWSNLLDWAGPDRAAAFVAAYESLSGTHLDPFWQMANLLEAGPDHWTPANLAHREPLLTDLVERLT